jgi:hypothetical protein
VYSDQRWMKWREGWENCVTGSFLNIIRIIKSRRMRWEGHVARIWEKKKCV